LARFLDVLAWRADDPPMGPVAEVSMGNLQQLGISTGCVIEHHDLNALFSAGMLPMDFVCEQVA
jgi:hypothetical protein